MKQNRLRSKLVFSFDIVSHCVIMSSNKQIVSSGSTTKEIKNSAVQEHRSSTQQSSQRTHISKTSGSEIIEKSSQSGGNATATTVTTIYDADGNVVKTIKNVDNKSIPTTQDRSIEYYKTSDNGRRSSDVSDRSSLNAQNGRRIESHHDFSERNVNDNQTGRRINVQQEHESRPYSPTPSQSESVATTYLVDENYVDTNKIRNKNASSDFKNFYGHGVDSSRTVVGNTYDSNAVQNTIGTKGRVIMDHNIDTTDVVFSNDRNYGKTGWNGQFLNEEPPVQRVVPVTKQKEWERPTSLRTKAKLRPEDLPPAGVPSVKK